MKKDGTFSVEDAGFTVGVNVKVTKRNKDTGAVIEERQGHNTCLKMQLMGLVKWLNGDFNETQNYNNCNEWIPRYLGVGTNLATYESPGGVKTEVNINDTRLLSEISPRIKLPERNTIVNRSTQRYVQLVISCYLPSEYYNGETIAEAGLFSKETGNNCLFRIVFDGINKTEDSVIEVDWTISVISIESTDEEYVEIDKTDLQNSVDALLDLYGQKVPPFTESCQHIQSPALGLLTSTSATQMSIDNATELITADYNTLKDITIGGTGINTEDGTVQPTDIAKDKIAYSKGIKVTGSLDEILANGYITTTFEDIKDYNGDTYIRLLHDSDNILRAGSYSCVAQDMLVEGINLTPEVLKEGVQILGVSGTYKGNSLDTSSGNVTDSDIAKGKIAFSKGERIVGSLVEKTGGLDHIVASYPYNDGENQYELREDEIYIKSKYIEDTIQRKESFNEYRVKFNSLASAIGLTPDKIKAGQTILGVTGTYTGE